MTAIPLAAALLVTLASFARALTPDAGAISCLDVRASGAVGDGKADDTGAIERAIRAAGQLDRDTKTVRPTALFLPPGVFRVTRTIVISEQPGQSTMRAAAILGSGHLVANGTSAAHSTILWDGAAGQPVLDFRGCGHFRLADFKVDGAGKAGVILRMNSVNGIGTGQFSVERMQLDRGETGIELGAEMDMCASDMTFTDVLIDNMRAAGFRTEHDQQVNYVFTRCSVAHSPVGFHFRHGGSAHFVLPAFFAVDTCFDLSGAVNNGSYSITGLFLERHSLRDTEKRMVILRARGEVNVSITAIQTGCQNVFGPKADLTTPNFVLGPSAQVTVRDSILSGKTATLTGVKGGPPTWLQFDNCRFTRAADPRRDIDCDANSGFELRNCAITVDDTRGETYKVLRHEMVASFSRLPTGARGETKR